MKILTYNQYKIINELFYIFPHNKCLKFSAYFQLAALLNLDCPHLKSSTVMCNEGLWHSTLQGWTIRYFSNLLFHGLLFMGHDEGLYYMKYVLRNALLWRRLMEISPDAREVWGDGNCHHDMRFEQTWSLHGCCEFSITLASHHSVLTYLCRSRLTVNRLPWGAGRRKMKMQCINKYKGVNSV